MGRTGLVQTQLHTDNDHTDSDRSGRAFTIVGSCGGQISAKCRVEFGINVHGSLQYIPGGKYTYRLEL